MCQHCKTTNSPKAIAPISRIQHIRNTVDTIDKPFLGFHRANQSGVFTLTYAFEVHSEETNKVLQYLRFDVTALFDGTFDIVIADVNNNVLHEVNHVSALAVRDFMDSLIFVDELPKKEGEERGERVKTVNIAVKHGYHDNKDSIISYLMEQDKTALTVYLGMGGIVVDRHGTVKR